MTTRERFDQHLRTLRKQSFLRALMRIAGDTLLIALSLVTALLVLRKAKPFMIPAEGYGIYSLFCLLSLGFALLIEIRAPNRFFKELMDVDQRFQLGEMLSTAYEYLREGRKTIFLERLFEEASRFLSRVKVCEVLPVRFLGRHAGIPLLAVVLILVFSLDILPAKTPLPMEYNPALHRLAFEMEKISQGKKNLPDGMEKKGEDKISKKMKELQRELQNRSLSSKKALQSLRELLEEVQNEQGKLARQLVQELSLQKIDAVPSINPELQKGIPLKSLRQLEDFLGEFFGGDVPDSLNEKLMALKSLRETQQGLGSAMEGIQTDSRESPPVAKSEKESRDRSPDPQGGGFSHRPGGSEGEGPEGDDEEDLDAMESSLAGRARDSREPTNPQEMDRSGNIPMKDRGFVGPGKTYGLLVRSLPMVEKGRMKPEDLIRSFTREIEEVLTKEEIPLNDREFIRSYFLSIGAERESGKNE